MNDEEYQTKVVKIAWQQLVVNEINFEEASILLFFRTYL